eukprot:1986886-Rhodomonas_salina.2
MHWQTTPINGQHRPLRRKFVAHTPRPIILLVVSGPGSRAQDSEILVPRRGQGSGITGSRSGFKVQGSRSRVQGSGFRVQGSGVKVQGSGLKVQDSGLRILDSDSRFRGHGSGSTLGVHGLGFRVQGSAFRGQGSGFRVQGSGFRVQCSGFTCSIPLGPFAPGRPAPELVGEAVGRPEEAFGEEDQALGKEACAAPRHVSVPAHTQFREMAFGSAGDCSGEGSEEKRSQRRTATLRPHKEQLKQRPKSSRE